MARQWLRVAVMAAALSGAAFAAPEEVALSGHEVFPGVSIGQGTRGAVFAGWISETGAGWQGLFSEAEKRGGWFASINYSGAAREAGASISITGGYWSLESSAGSVRSGRISGGSVAWPGPLASAVWPCRDPSGAYPVAHIVAKLSTTTGKDRGVIEGCLDDIHWEPRKPLNNVPKIWGVLRFEPAHDRDLVPVTARTPQE